MAPPRKITRDSLKRAPRHLLDEAEQRHAEHLLDIADKREWSEPERRKAADHEVKAWAIQQGTWNFSLREIKDRHPDLFRK
jgi:hypothetical protein